VLHAWAAPGWGRRRRGTLRLYEHSLSIALLGLFALAFTGHVVTGAHAYSAEQAAHHHAPKGD